MYYEYFVVCGVYKNKIGGCRLKGKVEEEGRQKSNKNKLTETY